MSFVKYFPKVLFMHTSIPFISVAHRQRHQRQVYSTNPWRPVEPLHGLVYPWSSIVKLCQYLRYPLPRDQELHPLLSTIYWFRYTSQYPVVPYNGVPLDPVGLSSAAGVTRQMPDPLQFQCSVNHQIHRISLQLWHKTSKWRQLYKSIKQLEGPSQM